MIIKDNIKLFCDITLIIFFNIITDITTLYILSSISILCQEQFVYLLTATAIFVLLIVLFLSFRVVKYLINNIDNIYVKH